MSVTHRILLKVKGRYVGKTASGSLTLVSRDDDRIVVLADHSTAKTFVDQNGVGPHEMVRVQWLPIPLEERPR